MRILAVGFSLVLTALIALLAEEVVRVLPIGPVVLAMLIGLLVGAMFALTSEKLSKPESLFLLSMTYCERVVLSIAITLMGVKLDYLLLQQLGFPVLIILLMGVTVTLGVTALMARLFSIDKPLVWLLGIGHAICGSAAIAATHRIVGASRQHLLIAMAVIQLLGTLGFFLLLAVSQVLDAYLSDIQLGLLIGNALQAVGHVVAAGFVAGEAAGQSATVIKMGRILMLIPILLILTVWSVKSEKIRSASQYGATHGDPSTSQKYKNWMGQGYPFPFFVFGFIVFSLLNTFQILPTHWLEFLSKSSDFALLMAMAALGLNMRFKGLLASCKSAFILGVLIFIFQIFCSFALVKLLII